MPLVYLELRRRAAACLRRGRRGQTLRPTALVDRHRPDAQIDPGDKEGKNVNFRRAGLLSEWMSVMARLDPAKAVQAAAAHGGPGSTARAAAGTAEGRRS